MLDRICLDILRIGRGLSTCARHARASGQLCSFDLTELARVIWSRRLLGTFPVVTSHVMIEPTDQRRQVGAWIYLYPIYVELKVLYKI